MATLGGTVGTLKANKKPALRRVFICPKAKSEKSYRLAS
jgi:hypothetical protein